MQPGDFVLVRVFGNKELIRRVVALKKDCVLICTNEEYERAISEGREPISVGFKYEDILGKMQPKTQEK
ncbi:3'5'-cyclic nucleotide phosphodiesterase family protein [Thermanaeromonas toyohensis ToBE]|uniref:3'5'-cyclic nucleotide phosphodiesterase family protein n=1 Tax=Thermanaeromonas toyohensis ToBE TaxID=698762 RepID=A0A1W1VX57_9FIRM|nr:hypothetical protein [Thermanaeromonas toyohensis]SMB97916.1 3'5'-cyclic nucleotide phosphodiesterase family protein [Thermanaeromonas toyohensis ToBE]